jgi:hypothetical protein
MPVTMAVVVLVGMLLWWLVTKGLDALRRIG